MKGNGHETIIESMLVYSVGIWHVAVCHKGRKE
jgi:hypothetical protein